MQQTFSYIDNIRAASRDIPQQWQGQSPYLEGVEGQAQIEMHPYQFHT